MKNKNLVFILVFLIILFIAGFILPASYIDSWPSDYKRASIENVTGDNLILRNTGTQVLDPDKDLSFFINDQKITCYGSGKIEVASLNTCTLSMPCNNSLSTLIVVSPTGSDSVRCK